MHTDKKPTTTKTIDETLYELDEDESVDLPLYTDLPDLPDLKDLEKVTCLQDLICLTNKQVPVNIWLSSKDLDTIKQKATYDRLPYQTLISDILHEYANNNKSS